MAHEPMASSPFPRQKPQENDEDCENLPPSPSQSVEGKPPSSRLRSALTPFFGKKRISSIYSDNSPRPKTRVSEFPAGSDQENYTFMLEKETLPEDSIFDSMMDVTNTQPQTETETEAENAPVSPVSSRSLKKPLPVNLESLLRRFAPPPSPFPWLMDEEISLLDVTPEETKTLETTHDCTATEIPQPDTRGRLNNVTFESSLSDPSGFDSNKVTPEPEVEPVRDLPVSDTSPGSNLNSTVNNLNSTGINLNSTVNNLNSTGNNLNSTGNNLNSTGSNLNSTGSNLNSTGSNLNSTGNNLNSTGNNLNSTGNNLNSTGSNLNSTGSNLNSTGSNLNSTGSNLNSTGSNLNSTGNNLNSTGNNLNSTGNNLNATVCLNGTFTVAGSQAAIAQNQTMELSACDQTVNVISKVTTPESSLVLGIDFSDLKTSQSRDIDSLQSTIVVQSFRTSTPMSTTKSFSFAVKHEDAKTTAAQRPFHEEESGKPAVPGPSSVVCARQSFLRQPSAKSNLQPLKLPSLPSKSRLPTSRLPKRPVSSTSAPSSRTNKTPRTTTAQTLKAGGLNSHLNVTRAAEGCARCHVLEEQLQKQNLQIRRLKEELQLLKK